MSSNKSDDTNGSTTIKHSDGCLSDRVFHPHSSGMTPSIITTINNTSPTPPSNSTNSNVNVNSKTTRRPTEPYESYIEDSFVGHWEREDDDPHEEYKIGCEDDDPNHGEEDEEALHPSTIEFDFDSFGPESFIYTPAPAKQQHVVSENVSGNEPTDSNQVEQLQATKEDSTQQGGVSIEQANANPQLSQLHANNLNPQDYLVDTAQIDLKVIEPYKKVISHAGYCHHLDTSVPGPNSGEPAPAVIVFSACYLPDRSRRDYNYVMDHLFLYVLSALHELIADDYILIYLHNTQPSNSVSSQKVLPSTNLANGSATAISERELQHQNNLPTFTWMKRCYQMIDRKLRKNLKILYLVKPTFWLKTIVIMCKPFISSKFSKKLRFVEGMEDLKKCLPVDKLILPASAENI